MFDFYCKIFNSKFGARDRVKTIHSLGEWDSKLFRKMLSFSAGVVIKMLCNWIAWDSSQTESSGFHPTLEHQKQRERAI